MKKSILGIGVLVVMVIVLYISFKQTSNSNDIKIGVIAPLTGVAAAYGEPASRSALLAQKEINDNGGVLGKKLSLIVEDGKCEGTATANAAHKLIDINKVGIILGGHCSTETLTIAPIAEQSKVLVLASITSSPAVTNSGDYIFRNSPSSAFYTAKSADYAYSKGYRKIVALYENKDFPVGVFQAFSAEFTKLGGTIVSSESFNSDVNDLRSYILKIDKQKPDAILFASQGPGAAVTFLKQVKELGVLSKYPIVGGAQNVTKDIDIKTDGLLNNPNIFTTDAYADPAAGKTGEFVKNYISAYKELPPTNLSYLASSYDAVYIIKEAMESCKSTADVACMKKYLYTIKDRIGAAGSLTIDKNGDASTPIGLHYFDAKGNEIWQELK